MKWKIYKLIEPEQLSRPGEWGGRECATVLEEVNTWYVSNPHRSYDEALQAIRNLNSISDKLHGMTLTILPIIQVAYDGSILGDTQTPKE